MKSTFTLKIVFLICISLPAFAQRQMENLGRGLIAIHQGKGKVYIGWRMLGTDPDNIAFNLYRSTNNAQALKLNNAPLTHTTDYLDNGVDTTKNNAYYVKALINGKEAETSKSFVLKAGSPAQPYFSVPLQTPAGYRPNDASVGDLDGDGECSELTRIILPSTCIEVPITLRH